MNKPPGVVRPEELYLVRELRARADLGDFTWREARASGLKIRRLGRKLYVLGADFIEFVLRVSNEREQAATEKNEEAAGVE